MRCVCLLCKLPCTRGSCGLVHAHHQLAGRPPLLAASASAARPRRPTRRQAGAPDHHLLGPRLHEASPGWEGLLKPHHCVCGCVGARRARLWCGRGTHQLCEHASGSRAVASRVHTYLRTYMDGGGWPGSILLLSKHAGLTAPSPPQRAAIFPFIAAAAASCGHAPLPHHPPPPPRPPRSRLP